MFDSQTCGPKCVSLTIHKLLDQLNYFYNDQIELNPPTNMPQIPPDP